MHAEDGSRGKLFSGGEGWGSVKDSWPPGFGSDGDGAAGVMEMAGAVLEKHRRRIRIVDIKAGAWQRPRWQRG